MGKESGPKKGPLKIIEPTNADFDRDVGDFTFVDRGAEYPALMKQKVLAY